ncbi:MAG: RNA polymerase sigma factor [bacterium]|nr:RNA polymerase sigma factor [bacterium]
MKQQGYGSMNREKTDFDRFYSQYYKPVYRFVFRISGDTFEAEDIAQETFIRLSRHLESAPREETKPAWLYKVATNLCYNQLKRKSKFRTIIDEMGQNRHKAQNTNEVEARYMQDEKTTHVRAALSQLPRRDQVLLMLYQDGLSYNEIAEIVNVKKTSVGKLLTRAIDKCSKKIKEQETKKNKKQTKKIPGKKTKTKET